MFGTWLRCASPVSHAAPASKKPAVPWSAATCIMIAMRDVLVWPVNMEHGSSDVADGVRIPFS
eukprot:846459-Pyramimonas_sp.AAC.1